MKTNIIIQSDSTCSQCLCEVPKGSKVIYDEDIFCSDDCYMEWVLGCEEAEDELNQREL